MKPGISTTEFWLHLLAQLSGMAMTFAPNNKYVQMAGAAIQLVNPATYAFFRTNLKKIAMDAGGAALAAIQADIASAPTAAVATLPAQSAASASTPSPKA